jgi:hypothetical protein
MFLVPCPCLQRCFDNQGWGSGEVGEKKIKGIVNYGLNDNNNCLHKGEKIKQMYPKGVLGAEGQSREK